MDKHYDFYLLISGDFDRDSGKLRRVMWSTLDMKTLGMSAVQEKEVGSDEDLIDMLKAVFSTASSVFMMLKSLIIATSQPQLLLKVIPEQAARLNISLPPVFNTYIDLKTESQKLDPAFVAAQSKSQESEVAISAKILIKLVTDPPKVKEYFVKLRGMPYQVSAGEVARFLGNVSEDNVLLLFNRESRPLGEAIVRLYSEAQVEECMARHKERIGSRYVDIFKSSKEDWNYHDKNYKPSSADVDEVSRHGIVKLRVPASPGPTLRRQDLRDRGFL
jgi:hypothetical protein